MILPKLQLTQLSRIFLLSATFCLLFHVPVVIFRSMQDVGEHYMLLELVIVFASTLALFTVVNYISRYFVVIFFALGGAADYYLFFFRKTLDGGVLADLVSVELELILDYCNIYVLMSIIAASLLSLGLYRIKRVGSLSKVMAFILLATSVVLFIKADGKVGSGSFIVLRDYVPFNLFYSVRSLVREYIPHVNKLKTKDNPTERYSFLFDDKRDPVTVVLIIGESMRGDLIELNGSKYNNMPLLSKRKNIISFPHAIGSGTLTQVSIPYMLTSATPPNFNQATGELSIISIFKHLGFDTSWIGSQGVFGAWESTFASIMMEADHQVNKNDLQKALLKSNLYDEELLPFIDRRVADISGNNFMIIHLLGSHWNLSSRYPASFKTGFAPSCQASSPAECTKEELFNSYNNTIMYSDYVLNEIIKRFENKNAFIIYASDHGFSLGEGGLFTNGYAGDNVPPEQLNIAFFTWASDKFIQNNKANYKNILDKKSQHISHDYIVHSLLGCINVKSGFIDSTLNLCK